MLGRFSANMGGTTARFFILPQIPDPIVSTQRLPMREDRILSTQRLPVCEDRILSIQRYVARAEMNFSIRMMFRPRVMIYNIYSPRSARMGRLCLYVYATQLIFYDTLHVLIPCM